MCREITLTCTGSCEQRITSSAAHQRPSISPPLLLCLLLQQPRGVKVGQRPGHLCSTHPAVHPGALCCCLQRRGACNEQHSCSGQFAPDLALVQSLTVPLVFDVRRRRHGDKQHVEGRGERGVVYLALQVLRICFTGVFRRLWLPNYHNGHATDR